MQCPITDIMLNLRRPGSDLPISALSQRISRFYGSRMYCLRWSQTAPLANMVKLQLKWPNKHSTDCCPDPPDRTSHSVEPDADHWEPRPPGNYAAGVISCSRSALNLCNASKRSGVASTNSDFAW